MYTTKISAELGAAISILEDLLNTPDGEAFIENIKKYKKTRSLNEIGYKDLNMD
jgi:hypothetical protein